MRGTRIFTISLLFALTGFGAWPDYFPLQPGNQWIYRCAGNCAAEPQVVEVTKWDVVDGKLYWLLKGFYGRQNWLRMDDDGVLWAFDPESKRESRWYSFFAAEREKFETSVDPCSPVASIASKRTTYAGPVGEYGHALLVTYDQGACMDAGLSREFFLPWIGLVHRTENTIAGPRRWDLIYSHTGGLTVLQEKHLTTGLTLDRSTYVSDLEPPVDPNRARPLMTARLNLRNSTMDPVKLEFPSGQRYDFEIRSEKGEVIYRWSDGKAFPLVMGYESFGPGERNYVIAVRLAGRDGKPLPPGKYVAEAWLATTAPQGFRASAVFEVVQVF